MPAVFAAPATTLIGAVAPAAAAAAAAADEPFPGWCMWCVNPCPLTPLPVPPLLTDSAGGACCWACRLDV